MLIKFLALITLASAAIRDCSDGLSLFRIKNLAFWPDPAVPNKNSTISFAYKVPRPGVSAGTATYSGFHNNKIISTRTEDICKSVACPIHEGSHNSSWSYIFPNFTGNLQAKIQWHATNGLELLCAEFSTISQTPAPNM
jgi:hypothetical protein